MRLSSGRIGTSNSNGKFPGNVVVCSALHSELSSECAKPSDRESMHDMAVSYIHKVVTLSGCLNVTA